MRSGAFLLMAAGTLVAAAYAAARVFVPCSGQLAVNPPLTSSRLGSCSTRSTHPYTLHLFNRLIRDLDPRVTMVNPYLLQTKGDVCRIGAEAGLPLRMLATTISCGHPGYDGKARHYRNCGYCHACLIRRAGLRAALASDPTHYVKDPRRRSLLADRPVARKQLRAETATVLPLIRWLCRDFTVHDLIRGATLPPDADIPALMSVMRRGRTDLAEMLDESFTDDLRRTLHWSPAP